MERARFVTRRRFLAQTGTLTLGLLAACAAPAPSTTAPAATSAPAAAATQAPAAAAAPTQAAAAPAAKTAGPLQLDFLQWGYGIETVKDNITKFEQRNPGISIQLSDVGWSTYHESTANRFQAKTPTDVLYNGG